MDTGTALIIDPAQLWTPEARQVAWRSGGSLLRERRGSDLRKALDCFSLGVERLDERQQTRDQSRLGFR